MSKRSLYLVGALTGALLWSVAAQAAPGQTTGNVNMQSNRHTAYQVTAQTPAPGVVDIAWRRHEPRRHVYRYFNPAPSAYYDEYPYDDPGSYDDSGPLFGGFGFGFSHHGNDFGHGFGGGQGGMGGGHGFGGGGMGGHGGGGGGRR